MELTPQDDVVIDAGIVKVAELEIRG